MMKPFVLSLFALLLSINAASAFVEIEDIGLLVLPNHGRNVGTRCQAEAPAIKDALLNVAESITAAVTAEEANGGSGSGGGGVGGGGGGGVRRKLSWCYWCIFLCAGFPNPGQCYVVYPWCDGCRRRELEEEQAGEPFEIAIKPTTTTVSHIRGRQRELPYVEGNGFWSHFSIDHPKATHYCHLLMAGVEEELAKIPNELSLTAGCNAVMLNETLIGCAYMMAPPPGLLQP